MSSKSIEELENYVWPASENLSGKMIECGILRKIPLEDLEMQSILHLLKNNVGTAYLISKAFGVIEKEPLVMIDYYEGDLLEAVITLPDNELQRHGELIQKLLVLLNSMGKSTKNIKKHVKMFKKTYS